jgi:hypothetical protein
VQLVSTSDVSGAIYLVCTIFVFYTCIYASDLLPQRSESRICKNYISVFLFANKTFFCILLVYTITKYVVAPKRTVPRGPGGSETGTVCMDI